MTQDSYIYEIVDEEQGLNYSRTPFGAVIVGWGDIEKAVFASLIRKGDIWIKTDRPSWLSPHDLEGELWIS